MNQLPERLKEKRKAKGMTQAEVAEQLKISRVAYTHYEKGTYEPSLDILIKLANIFETSTDYLLGRY